jgi:hypothetical protein
MANVFTHVNSCTITYFSRHILDLILSSDEQDREQVVESIHNYLRKVGEETRAGLIDPEKFIINKVFFPGVLTS